MSCDNDEANKRECAFVNSLIERMQSDHGFRARFSRADNPATEYQCWEHLVAFNIDLDKNYLRLPYTTIGAAISKARLVSDGNAGIGKSLASCYPDGNKSDQAKSKLRRLLACNTVEEVCRILRPLLSFISSNANAPICFRKLLNDLVWFNRSGQRVKEQWAQDFYYLQKTSPERVTS